MRWSLEDTEATRDRKVRGDGFERLDVFSAADQ